MNILKVLFITFSLCGYLAFAANQLKLSILAAFFPLNGLIILTLYLFGFFYKLDFGYYFIILIGFLLFLFNLKFLIKFNFERNNWYLYLYTIPFFLLVIFIPQNFFYYRSDELYFWGSSVKWMYHNNKIYDSSFPVPHRFYPPGQQIFQYFFLKTFGFKESYLLKAQNYLILSNFLFIAVGSSKKIKRGIILFFILVSLPFFVQFSYANIMNDLLLSTYISASIVASWKFVLSKSNFVIYLISITPIILLKNNAILFLIPILFVAFLNL